MKAKNSFAFGDFDKDKILQRKLFGRAEVDGEFFLKDNQKSDGEILKPLQATGDVNVNENNLKKLRIMLEITKHYQEKVIDKRHLPRLTRFKRATKSEELRQRADELQKKYDDIANTLTIFAAILRRDIENLAHETASYYSKTFAARLKKARKEKGLTQVQIATDLNMSRPGYVSYELARREPSLSTLARIARILGTSTDYLLGLTQ